MTQEARGAGVRPVCVLLGDQDVLYFHHIPKTAGLSVIALLDARFHPDHVFPLHSAPEDDSVERALRAHPHRVRFVRGHFTFGPLDTGIYRHVCRNPVRATMLRDPVERTISAYRHIMRRPQSRHHATVTGEHMDLLAFVRDPRFFPNVWNTQTRLLVGEVPGLPRRPDAPRALSDRALVEVAKERLEQCAWIGITERMNESMQLAAYTFGWPPFPEVPRLNAAPDSASRDDFPLEAIEAIAERTALDREVYDHATRLFETRWSAMLADLLEQSARRVEQREAPSLIRDIEARVNRQQEEITRLKAIEASWGWRMLVEISAWRRRLIPPGSAREKAYLRMKGALFGRWLRRPPAAP